MEIYYKWTSELNTTEWTTQYWCIKKWTLNKPDLEEKWVSVPFFREKIEITSLTSVVSWKIVLKNTDHKWTHKNWIIQLFTAAMQISSTSPMCVCVASMQWCNTWNYIRSSLNPETECWHPCGLDYTQDPWTQSVWKQLLIHTLVKVFFNVWELVVLRCVCTRMICRNPFVYCIIQF